MTPKSVQLLHPNARKMKRVTRMKLTMIFTMNPIYTLKLLKRKPEAAALTTRTLRTLLKRKQEAMVPIIRRDSEKRSAKVLPALIALRMNSLVRLSFLGSMLMAVRTG
jgi:hypothetical protein